MMTPEQRRHWVRVVLSFDPALLTAAQKNVLLALETFADYRNGTNARPGETNLAALCALTPRAVRTALARGRELGLIEQTGLANSRMGLAAVYRLLPNNAVVGFVGPVDHPTTGTAVPVNEPTTGTTVPVNNSTTGTAVHHDRNGHDTTTGTAVPPTLPSPPNHPPNGVLRNPGTSPERAAAITHTEIVPSRFCDDHPLGFRGRCPDCANARTAFDAWQAAAAERDVALAAAEDLERRRRRKLIDNCLECDDFGRDDDLQPCPHPPERRVGYA